MWVIRVMPRVDGEIFPELYRNGGMDEVPPKRTPRGGAGEVLDEWKEASPAGRLEDADPWVEDGLSGGRKG